MESFDDVDWRVAMEFMRGQKWDIAISSAMDSYRGTIVLLRVWRKINL